MGRPRRVDPIYHRSIMRLANFILANVDEIVLEWEGFARSIWPGDAVDPATLRDHARDMLVAIAADIDADQSDEARSEKSRGLGADSHHSDEVNHASLQHGSARVRSGFHLPMLIAEYRALRAAVLRRWHQGRGSPDERDLEDIMRFNESVDQSLTKAVGSFSVAVDWSRQMFLAVLAHDLRDPLNAISLSAHALSLQGGVDPRFSDGARRITNSSTVMQKIVLDLIDFAGSQLGGRMPVSPSAMDLKEVAEDVVSELRAGNPARLIEFASVGDLTMKGDPTRLRQAVSNVLSNAIQHSAATSPITLVVGREGAEIVMTVHNEGPSIPQDKLASIFDPLARAGDPADGRRRAGSLGLGLYIAREVVTAHGGTIEVQSSIAAGTTFTIRLPLSP